MKKHGIFDVILPGMNIKNSYKFTNSKVVNLALLCSASNMSGMEISNYLMDRLRISKEDSRTISILHNCREIELDSSIKSVRRFLAFHEDEMRMMIIEYLKSLDTDLDEFISNLNSVKFRENNKPLIDGNMLSDLTGLEPSIRLGKLKDWLFRIQIEEDITEIEEVLNALNELDWKDSDIDNWVGMKWP